MLSMQHHFGLRFSPIRTWANRTIEPKIHLGFFLPIRTRRFLPIRTWGQLSAAWSSRSRFLFTHTHMGPTSELERLHTLVPFHPYAHGTNHGRVDITASYYFSPIRTWDQLSASHYSDACFIFTHTHMGPTCIHWLTDCFFTFHPYAHGTNTVAGKRWVIVSFSPIRTWDQLMASIADLTEELFTHTHMGPTPWEFTKWPTNTFHPYAHGTNRFCAPLQLAWNFSPIRTWDQRRNATFIDRYFLFTHTHMGPTLANSDTKSTG